MWSSINKYYIVGKEESLDFIGIGKMQKNYKPGFCWHQPE